jgi:hypothetical protein
MWGADTSLQIDEGFEWEDRNGVGFGFRSSTRPTITRGVVYWSDWTEWRVSARYIEELTGLDFLSNVPQAIQDIIEIDSISPILSFTDNSNVANLPDAEEDISASLLAGKDNSSFNQIIDSRNLIVESFSVVSPIKNSFFTNINPFDISITEASLCFKTEPNIQTTIF